MKYWPSYCNYDTGSSSGAYAFRPIDGLYEPLHYTNLKSQRIYNETKLVQKMVLYFEQKGRTTDVSDRNVIVHIMFDQDFGVLKYDVDLDSLPNVYLDGYEFVV